MPQPLEKIDTNETRPAFKEKVVSKVEKISTPEKFENLIAEETSKVNNVAESFPAEGENKLTKQLAYLDLPNAESVLANGKNLLGIVKEKMSNLADSTKLKLKKYRLIGLTTLSTFANLPAHTQEPIGGPKSKETGHKTIYVSDPKDKGFQAYRDSSDMHTIREQSIELVKKANTYEEADKAVGEFEVKNLDRMESALDGLMADGKNYDSKTEFTKTFPGGKTIHLDRFEKPVQPFALETYMMPNGNRYTYEEMIKAYPMMKDPKTYKANFHREPPVFNIAKTEESVAEKGQKEYADKVERSGFPRQENPLRKDPKLQKIFQEKMIANLPNEERLAKWEDQAKPDYPERFVKIMLEQQERENDNDVKKIIENAKEKIEYKQLLLKYQENNPEEWYDNHLATVRQLFPEDEEKVLQDRKTDQKLFKKEIEEHRQNIALYKNQIQELTAHPEKNKHSKEQLLKWGKVWNEKAKANLAEYEKDKKAVDNSQNLFPKLDREQAWLNQTIQSPEYQERLVKFEGMNPEEVAIRYGRVNSGDFEITTNKMEDSHYETGKGVTINAMDAMRDDRASGLHERVHQSTDGEKGMSEYAKDLYRQAQTEENLSNDERMMNLNLQFPEQRNLVSPPEDDARKKVFEYDMDRLGVKKYGEQFTNEHYQKMLELQKQGKLLENSNQFLKIIKPEFIEKVMNTIAKSNSAPVQGSEEKIV